MQTLQELAQGLDTDKASAHSYLAIYEQFFLPIRNRPITLLEIGVATGGSMRLWRRAFPAAVLHGIDIDPPEIPDVNCVLHKFSQNCREKIEEAWPDETFDIIIDDGSHFICDQVVSLAFLWPKLKPGGYYFVEDVPSRESLKYFAPFRPIAFDHSTLKPRKDDILLVCQKFR